MSGASGPGATPGFSSFGGLYTPMYPASQTASAYPGISIDTHGTGIATQNTGSGTLFSLVQPTIAAFVFIYAGV